jgi:arylsulfatase A-like enzyme
VQYDLALAPAPWTFPSHASFFTGYWPYQLDAQCRYSLDAPVPTLAEYLTSRGYLTAGFAANTNCCSYESGLDRGFIHYEDYPLTPYAFVGRTLPGSWLLRNVWDRGDYYAAKWLRPQTRDAAAINDSFLGWLEHRRRDRPFFAFLNYFDAHAPYVPPPGWAGRAGSGSRPRAARDYQFLTGEMKWSSDRVSGRDIRLARDCYNACIAYLDDQLGRLLDELERQGLLEETLVVITSDHGEAFGDHGLFGHTSSVYLDQVSVPLVVFAPGAPAGRVVREPVSLRDLPATIVDQLGLTQGGPFPGHSLAAHWRSDHGSEPPRTSPALSEVVQANAFGPQPRRGLGRKGFAMSLVAEGRHYIREGTGAEQLYNLWGDPSERSNRAADIDSGRALRSFRRTLLGILETHPGAPRVEQAYLKAYRQWLEQLVPGSSRRPPVVARR